MSILLTTSSKKTRAAKKKANASHAVSRIPCLAEGSGPPSFSDETTSVWFWKLDGNPTTVTYNKTKNEVRCNGFILDAYDGFIEGEDDDLDAEDDDDYDTGSVIDFAIFVAESQTSHEGRLIRLPPSASSGLRTHNLYVDGVRIPEHRDEVLSKDPYDVAVPASDDDVNLLGGSRDFEYAAGTSQFRYEDEPPPYDFSMQGDGAHTQPSW